MTTATDMLDLEILSRAEKVRFDLVDKTGTVLGAIHPVAAVTISNDGGAHIKRTLSGFELSAFEYDDVNPLTDRVRPYWVLSTGDEYPLGVFLFAEASTQRWSFGRTMTASLVDQGLVLAQEISESLGFDAGTTASAAIVRTFEAAGFYGANVATTAYTFGSPLAYPAGRGGATYASILDELCQKAGYYCLGVDTKILCADLMWRSVGDLYVGDEIIGFDEDPTSRQRFKPSTVTSIGGAMLDSYEVTTRFGVTTASAGHRWLVREYKNRSRRVWRTTEELRRGDEIIAFGAPWSLDDSREAGYLAGFFDGEGTLSGGGGPRGTLPRLSAAQLPGRVLDRVTEALDARGFNYTLQKNEQTGVVNFAIRGGKYESLRFLGTVRPDRLLAKSSALWDGAATWGHGQENWIAPVLGIRHVGPQRVITIGTSTATLIADGLLSHNSAYFDNNGTPTVRATETLAGASPTLRYVDGGRINSGSIVESNDLLKAPNRFLVIDTSATTGDISYVYDIPASAPHSYENRGFRITKTIEAPGVGDKVQAENVARAYYSSNPQAYETALWSSPPDPRHDTFDIIDYRGVNYLELGWSLTCAPGGAHAHTASRVYL